MTFVLDYPVAPEEDIEPIFYRIMIIQAMALRYLAHMNGSPEPFDLADAMDAAHSTWDTEWETDPAPRTISAGVQEADNDLAYWYEE